MEQVEDNGDMLEDNDEYVDEKELVKKKYSGNKKDETAKIASSTLMDFGVVTKNYSTMVIDHNKVKRSQTEVIKMVTESQNDELKKRALITCCFMVELIENSRTQYHGVIKKGHYSVCDSKGNFLFPNIDTLLYNLI